MKVTQLVDRYGSNRQNSHLPGELLRGCSCIAIPFAGGMCEVPHMTANIINVNDLDRAVMNLAGAIRLWRGELVQELDATPFHPDVLAESQRQCREFEKNAAPLLTPNKTWAYHYFICSWMTRGGKGGTKGEFDAGLSVRWKSGGGDSVVRFRSATESLAAWEKVMRRCTFHTRDAFDFIAECKERDVIENGIFVDAPWPEDGDSYKHKFSEVMQLELRNLLESFVFTRIVVRFGDHPLIRELYRPSHWTWNIVTSRTQANASKAEMLLTNWSEQ